MKTVLEKATDLFNDQDIEAMKEFWHQDISIYDLETNQLIVRGKNNVYELNKPYTLDPNRKIILNNVITFGNTQIGYKTFSHKEDHNIVICEIEDDLIKNVWSANFSSKWHL